MVRCHELTGQAWAEIAPLLPPTGRPGGQWADHRQVVNGILGKLATGVPWRDLPERYGPGRPAMSGSAAGRPTDLAAAAHPRSDQVRCRGEVDWEVVVDATIVRAHQHAAGARKRGRSNYLGLVAEADQALGRRRGGLTTKLHLAGDGAGRPLGMLVPAGQRHESTQLEPLLDAIRVPGQGRGGHASAPPT